MLDRCGFIDAGTLGWRWVSTFLSRGFELVAFATLLGLRDRWMGQGRGVAGPGGAKAPSSTT